MAEPPPPPATARVARPTVQPPAEESPFKVIEDYPIEDWATEGKSRSDVPVLATGEAGPASSAATPGDGPSVRIDNNTGVVELPVLPEPVPAPPPPPPPAGAIQERTPATANPVARRGDTATARSRTPLPDDLPPSAEPAVRGLDHTIRTQLLQAAREEKERKALAVLRAAGFFSEHVDYHGFVEDPAHPGGRLHLYLRQDGTLSTARRLLALGYRPEEDPPAPGRGELYAPREVERGLHAAADPERVELVEVAVRAPRDAAAELPGDPEGARLEMAPARRMFYLAPDGRLFTPRQWAAAKRAWERRLLPRLTTPITDAFHKTTRFFRRRG